MFPNYLHLTTVTGAQILANPLTITRIVDQRDGTLVAFSDGESYVVEDTFEALAATLKAHSPTPTP